MPSALQDRPVLASTRSPRRRRRAPLVLLAGVLAAAVAVPAAGRLDLWPSPGPASEQVDRTGPALELALEDLAEHTGAVGRYSVVVDLERDTRWLPSAVSGERTRYLAFGQVAGTVDLRALPDGAVRVSEDGRSARISLPPARLGPPVLDLERSRVLDRDRGLVDRVAGVLADSPTSEREVALRAEQRLAAAAAESDLLRRTEESTRRTLTGLARSLGVERVTVTFDAAGGV